jgi:hypothetical protein
MLLLVLLFSVDFCPNPRVTAKALPHKREPLVTGRQNPHRRATVKCRGKDAKPCSDGLQRISLHFNLTYHAAVTNWVQVCRFHLVYNNFHFFLDPVQKPKRTTLLSQQYYSHIREHIRSRRTGQNHRHTEYQDSDLRLILRTPEWK